MPYWLAPRWWENWLEYMRACRIVLQAAMCEVAQGGNMVYHGHLGHGFFPGIRNVLKVRFTAPRSLRVEQVRAKKELSEKDAMHYVEQVDQARSRRHEALFGTDWRNTSLYDIVLNLANMSP
jgi:cytidylate kinase